MLGDHVRRTVVARQHGVGLLVAHVARVHLMRVEGHVARDGLEATEPQPGVVDIREPDPDLPGVRAIATARVTGRTGVEMEALTACSVAALTVYDMCKAVDKAMTVTDLRVTHKSGGKSGTYEAA